MEIHLLDMGKTKYGDCILITHNNHTILIDGAHPGDTDSILSQLQDLLGEESPAIDLLIVTHCHSDHIGCLPDLITNDYIKIKYAIVADEKLGWGRHTGAQDRSDSINSAQKKLKLLLQEEDHSDLPSDELLQLLDDVATLEDKYIEMIDHLVENGTKVARYKGSVTPTIKSYLSKFTGLKLEILGPDLVHLKKCADVIKAAGASDFADTYDTLSDSSTDNDIVDSYKKIVSDGKAGYIDAVALEDRPGTGAAKNNQSIVLKVTADGWSALLAGDMQFAKAEIKGLNEGMEKLLVKASEDQKYDFVKLTHHTSYNGFDEKVLAAFSNTKLFGHSGGLKDPGHPDEGALELLKENKDELEFARTDHNGLITVKKQRGKVKMIISKGKINDFKPNPANDQEFVPTQTNTVQQAQTIEGRNEGFIEVITRIPNSKTKVTVTIEVDPEKKNSVVNQ